jgi:hypothetical protein
MCWEGSEDRSFQAFGWILIFRYVTGDYPRPGKESWVSSEPNNFHVHTELGAALISHTERPHNSNWTVFSSRGPKLILDWRLLWTHPAILRNKT